MPEICQKTLPDAPWTAPVTRRLPGVQPLDPKTWIVVDDAYGAQMAERARVLADHRDDVLLWEPSAEPAITDLYEIVIAHLQGRDDFTFEVDRCLRPDGAWVELDPKAPFETLNRLVTEDFCILQKREDEHVLTAALLCFPASWTLAEKFGHPLVRIHGPVKSYDDNIAARVQRLFDAVHVGRPLWRANAMRYVDPQLYQPRTESARRSKAEPGEFIRTERQSILRLPKTDAVVFSIQTRQVRISDLTDEQAIALENNPVDTEMDAENE